MIVFVPFQMVLVLFDFGCRFGTGFIKLIPYHGVPNSPLMPARVRHWQNNKIWGYDVICLLNYISFKVTCGRSVSFRKEWQRSLGWDSIFSSTGIQI
ncbi:hypothetical protein NPIL_665791 [Nephila pilipes]|uniref:Uncharacterized protein n=1 Tax=Nephila pilipes TaxID=299642 RepID=A0A8X6PAE0_NEPPI|nr:hypothetical protein NPIL_665791 [Nephila pilipes]